MTYSEADELDNFRSYKYIWIDICMYMFFLRKKLQARSKKWLKYFSLTVEVLSCPSLHIPPPPSSHSSLTPGITLLHLSEPIYCIVERSTPSFTLLSSFSWKHEGKGHLIVKRCALIASSSETPRGILHKQITTCRLTNSISITCLT